MEILSTVLITSLTTLLSTIKPFIRTGVSGIALVFFLLIQGCASTPPKEASGLDAFALVKVADKAYTEGRWLEAEQKYRQVIEKVPNDYYGWFRLANTQLRQGDVQSAVSFYSQAIKRSPNQAKPYYNLSTSYLLLSLQALHDADNRLRNQDPGKKAVANLIATIENLVNQPIQSTSSISESLPDYQLRHLLRNIR